MFMLLLMLFGGFYLNVENIWVGFKWIEIFSFVQYGYVHAHCLHPEQTTHVLLVPKSLSLPHSSILIKGGYDV
jgi:hypothetical protein